MHVQGWEYIPLAMVLMIATAGIDCANAATLAALTKAHPAVRDTLGDEIDARWVALAEKFLGPQARRHPLHTSHATSVQGWYSVRGTWWCHLRGLSMSLTVLGCWFQELQHMKEQQHRALLQKRDEARAQRKAQSKREQGCGCRHATTATVHDTVDDCPTLQAVR